MRLAMPGPAAAVQGVGPRSREAASSRGFPVPRIRVGASPESDKAELGRWRDSATHCQASERALRGVGPGSAVWHLAGHLVPRSLGIPG